jgi:membrane protease YdiL (CAAX protease family)
MKKSFKWIAEHQVSSFLILTFVFSWFFFLLSFFVFANSRLVQAISGKIAVFGPALIAMLVSAIAYPKPKVNRIKVRWSIFVAVWLFSWAVFLAYLSLVLQIPLRTTVIIGFGVCALLPAWVVSGSRSSNPGVRAQSLTLLNPRGSCGWYVLALISYPVVLLIGAFIAKLLGEDVIFQDLSVGNAILFPVLMFAEGYLASGGVNEESGWRGFLLPRLQQKQSVLVAAIIVWFFWALWHLPLDMAQGTPLQDMLLNRIVFNLLAAILFAWIYNRTNGSIVAPAIFHASMNTAGAFLPIKMIFLAPLMLLVIYAIVHDRMWKRLPEDHPAVHKALQDGTGYNHIISDVK